MKKPSVLMDYVEKQLNKSLSSFKGKQVKADTMAAVKYQVEAFLQDHFPSQPPTVKVYQSHSDPTMVMVDLPEWFIDLLREEAPYDGTRQLN